MSLAVVLTHWGPAIPALRLAQHWIWNSAVYRINRATVYVVADGPRELPDYARLVPCYEDLRPFNLSRTSNLGIRAALADGHAIIAKSDPDIYWPGATLTACAHIGDGRGLCPSYHMAASRAAVDGGVGACSPWYASCGTLCLHAQTWRDINGYDERMIGYGVEDGDAMYRAQARVRIDRAHIVYHVAHVEGSPQDSKRADHWGRDDSTNPINRRHNMQLFKASRSGRAPWKCDEWGTLQSPHTRPFSPRLDPSILYSPEGRDNPQSGGMHDA